MPEETQKLPAPSKEFLEAIIFRSSSSVQCEHCDRIHFEDEGGIDWEDRELEELIKWNKKEPDKYIQHESNPIWGYLGGKQYVADCPCNIASRYENFIWGNRHLIKDYLTARTKKELRAAQDNSKLAKEVSTLNLK